MVPKAIMLKSGDSVTVLAHKVVGLRAASSRYGINSKTKHVGGISQAVMAKSFAKMGCNLPCFQQK